MENREFQDLMPEQRIERRCPVCLLLDTSYSMEGKPIEELKEGVKEFVNSIMQDEEARRRVDLCVITFGGTVEVVQEFTPVDNLDVNVISSQLVPTSNTPMGTAIKTGIREIEDWKSYLKREGVIYYRPWLVCFTDGCPTDMNSGDSLYSEIKKELNSWNSSKKFIPWAFGTETADFNLLKDLFPQNHVYKLAEHNFRAVFQWLSASITQVSKSAPGSQVNINKPSVSNHLILEV
jgi:uncharacterized protein YegL